jgi:hypothetical protein
LLFDTESVIIKTLKEGRNFKAEKTSKKKFGKGLDKLP